jgi:hypothetical protein
MNKYVIDYGYGRAEFYTETVDPPGTPAAISMFDPLSTSAVRLEFLTCAHACFGIRKSLGDYELRETYTNVDLPIPYRGHGGTHFLSHDGDEILFDRNFEQAPDQWWKLHNEHGEWCSCKARGKAELACNVHHFWVPNHDELCRCQDRTVTVPVKVDPE